MQASNLEQYLKARKEDREYREDIKDAIAYASSELGVTTITVSYEKVVLEILAMIALIVLIIINKKKLEKFISNHLAKSQASSSSAARGIFSWPLQDQCAHA